MRTLPEGMAEALGGSTTAQDARMQFNLWYEGELIMSDVKVSNWALSWDISRQVQCQLKATILDEDGTLTPWDSEDPLGAGGGMLQSQLIVGQNGLGLAWQRITSAEPDETWRTVNGTTIWIPGGASIPIEADDLTEGVIAYRFMSPQQPVPGNTILQEIRLLLTDLLDVQVGAGVTDKAVPASVIYKEDRMAAVEDLVEALGAAWRVSGDGQFQLYDPTNTTPVWEGKGGSEGELIRVKRKLNIATNYNAFVSRNTAADGRELQGIAKVDSGPERFGGPLGHRVLFHAASFATTQTAVQKDATTTRDNRKLKATVILPVRVILNPAIELGDWVTIQMPLPDGGTGPVSGRVLSIDISGGELLPVGMDIKIECASADIRALSKRVRDGRWQSI